jgi:pimeloyl-ACP methyl ester carboxylesterase
MIGVLLASIGYAVALPDYLGLGGSPGYHPYQHATSEATAAVDMLRAVRAFCAGRSITLTNRLFLLGYSQGGHATMALHRELERYHRPEFTVTASAPMAGAYDLSGVTTADFLSGRSMPNPYYFAYLLAAYQTVYRLTNSLASLLVAPYNTSLPPLLDGYHSSSEIDAVMPAVTTQILKPEVLAAFQNNPQHPLRLALRDNDVYQWTPLAPMRLYHCSGDQDVVFTNSVVATNSFFSRGVVVPLVNTDPAASHGDCAIPSFLLAQAWFGSFP